MRCILAAAVLSMTACNKPVDDKAAEGPAPPSAAEVERDAVADFQSQQQGLPPPNPNAAFEGPFTAGGMEPFWSARIADGKFIFDRPEADPVEIGIGRLSPKNGVAKVSKNKLTMILAAQPCTDSSGAQADYRMLVTYQGDAYEGCARQGDAPANRDWSAYLDDFLPAIDSCLTKAKAKGIDARVTVAYPRTHGQAGVRLSDGLGGRWECGAETAAGGAVKFFDPLGEDDTLPGEWTPLFTRAPGAAPPGTCNRNLEAKSAGGEVLGWLTYESC